MKYKRLTLCTLLILLFALAACQSSDQSGEVAATEIAEEQIVEEVEPAEIAEEHTAEELEPTEIAKEQTMEEVDPAVAQEMAEFTSATEQFSLSYPLGWVVQEDVAGGVLAIANSETALSSFSSGQVELGDFALNVGFIPTMFLELIGVGLGETPESLLQSIMPVMRTRNDNTAVSEVQVVSLGGEREAALVMVSEDQSEGAFLVFPAAEGVIAFISAVGSPGGFEKHLDIALTTAATIDFNGDAEILWATMLGAE